MLLHRFPALVVTALLLASGGSPVHARDAATRPVFRRVWATSMEPQRIRGKSEERRDRYVNTLDHGCALPSKQALGRLVRVLYPTTGKTVLVSVVDVGPWNTEDPYWLVPGGRPAAELTRHDSRGRRTNGAGIDLSYGAWMSLGVAPEVVLGGKHSGWVDWEFVVEPGENRVLRPEAAPVAGERAQPR